MQKRIDEIEFTIFDTETTGLDPQSGDRIVEIAAIRFKGREKIATFQSLVNPRRPISEAAFAVNRITPEMLKDAPTIDKVLPGFLDFIRGSCLCSYNAIFDLEFLNHELASFGATLPADTLVVDILKMAKRTLPALERYALWFVADKLGVKSEQKHRALSDVELTLEVFQRLKAILENKGVADAAGFFGLFGFNSVLSDDIHNQKLAQIQQALDLGVKLKIKYFSGSQAAVSEREVIPKEIRQDKNRHYLVGYCCLRNEERTFRVDGILHLEIV